MSTIIAGRFEQGEAAAATLAAWADAGFAASAMTSFFVNPRGQHDLYPGGGDIGDSRSAHQAPAGAVVGGAVGGVAGFAAGAAAVMAAGPAAPVVAAAVIASTGVGAYAGSLLGSLNNLGKEVPAQQADAAEKAQEEDAPPRQSGMLVAVEVADPGLQQKAIEVLQQRGALDIEQSSGTIAASQWENFDPLRPLELVAAAH